MNKTQIKKVMQEEAATLATALSVGNGYRAIAARMARVGERIDEDVSGNMERAKELYAQFEVTPTVKNGGATSWTANGRKSTRWFQAATLAQHWPTMKANMVEQRDAVLSVDLTKSMMPTSPLEEAMMKEPFETLKDESKSKADWLASVEASPKKVVKEREKKQLGILDQKANQAPGLWALGAAQALAKLFHGTKGDAGQPGVSFDNADVHSALATAQKVLLAIAISDGVLDSADDAKKIKSLSVKAMPDDDAEISLKAILDTYTGDFRSGVKQAEPDPKPEEKTEPVTQPAGFELPDGFDLDVFTQLPGAAQATLMSAWAKKSAAQ